MVLYPVHLRRHHVVPARVQQEARPRPERRGARDVLGAMYARIDEDLDDLSR